MYKLGPKAKMTDTETKDQATLRFLKHLPCPPHKKFGNLPSHHHVRKPDPTGRPLGAMLTYQPGTFQKLPSSGSMMS